MNTFKEEEIPGLKKSHVTMQSGLIFTKIKFHLKALYFINKRLMY